MARYDPAEVAGAGLASVVVVALSFVVRGRLRETLAGFRFIATLLFVLATFAMLGTLILQMKPAAAGVDIAVRRSNDINNS